MLYWGIKVKKELSDTGEIFLHAETFNVENGDLLFVNEDLQIIFSISKGNWLCVFAASCLDGHAVGVEHWNKEK